MSMNTASSFSESARDTADDVREGVHEAGDATAAASADVQKDLKALRDDFSRLAERLSGILGTKGSAAWQRARASVDEAVSDAQGKGREAVDAVRGLSGEVGEAIEDSMKQRPYTTVAVALAVGFIFGTAWRR
jgi:ElaB/YqjD/DUF883 family membrane-anchored ribosome-binding protein